MPNYPLQTSITPNVTTGESSDAEIVHTKLNAYVDVKADFGAVGDGVTDDTAAIQAAIDVARALGGGTVYFPQAIYAISAPILVKTTVTIRGSTSGQYGAQLLGLPGFSGAGLVRIGAGDSPLGVYGCQAIGLVADCNNQSGLYGFFSTEAQEGSGLFFCQTVNNLADGVHFSGAACQEFVIRDFMGHVPDGGYGVYISGAGRCEVTNISAGGNVGGSALATLYIDGCSAMVWGVHGENVTDVVHLASGAATSVVAGVTAHSSVTNAVTTDTTCTIFGTRPNGSSVAINDTLVGSTSGAQFYCNAQVELTLPSGYAVPALLVGETGLRFGSDIQANLFLSGAGTLKTDGVIWIKGVTGTAGLYLGPAAATTLYENSAGVLKTDGNLVIGGLSATAITLGVADSGGAGFRALRVPN